MKGRGRGGMPETGGAVSFLGSSSWARTGAERQTMAVNMATTSKRCVRANTASDISIPPAEEAAFDVIQREG
jgi:hypothetical protein